MDDEFVFFQVYVPDGYIRDKPKQEESDPGNKCTRNSSRGQQARTTIFLLEHH